MPKKINIKKPLPLDNDDVLFIYVTDKEKGATGFLDGGFKMDNEIEEIFLNFNITVKFKGLMLNFCLSTLKNIQSGEVIESLDKIKFNYDIFPVRQLISSKVDKMINRLLLNCEFAPSMSTSSSLEEAILDTVISKIDPLLTKPNEINFIKKALQACMFKAPSARIDSQSKDLDKFWTNYRFTFEAQQQKDALESTLEKSKLPSIPTSSDTFKV